MIEELLEFEFKLFTSYFLTSVTVAQPGRERSRMVWP